MNKLSHRTAACSAVALLLAGCASFSPDGGMEAVAGLTKDRIGHTVAAQRSPQDADTVRTRVREILGQPLTPDTAVELALLNNRGLQASFSQLGIAEADLVQAGRLRNPLLSFGRLAGGGVVEIDRAIVFDVLGLLTLPAAREVEARRFEQAQLKAADDAVRIASETRRAWFGAVAAQELVGYFQQVQEAADASSELARRMAEAGNFSQLARMREQAFRADAVADLARARQQAVAERERLTRLLGLSGEQLDFKLPERLPELPSQPVEPRAAEQAALDKRLDVLMARRAAEATAKSLGLTKATRFVNALELGYQNRSETGSPTARGYEISLELPLFDFGSVRTARAEATYLQAVHHAADVALIAQSEVRESYAAYRTTYDLARHYRDEVVPLRKSISDENLLRYNGMLVSVFDLLADAREQVRAVAGSVQATRDFWIAQTNLQTALTGRSPGAAGEAAVTATPESRSTDH
ncbi:TolC family protein [Ideonella sp. YS5]|uniref:TolC family protein n=1 Tax=Ideonella sp. YS5 TaxID=3453714 RepID=UPI003EF08A48